MGIDNIIAGPFLGYKLTGYRITSRLTCKTFYFLYGTLDQEMMLSGCRVLRWLAAAVSGEIGTSVLVESNWL